jgi:hypothetical protein
MTAVREAMEGFIITKSQEKRFGMVKVLMALDYLWQNYV